MFVVAFGALLVDQLAQLVSRIPDLIDSALVVGERDVLDGADPGVAALVDRRGGDLDFGSLAAEFGPNLLGIVTSFLGSVFGLFTFALFAFYFSADMPDWNAGSPACSRRGRRASSRNVWHLTAQKTGSYVGARVMLALRQQRLHRHRVRR